jgi:small-conductance mechanosensitive channel
MVESDLRFEIDRAFRANDVEIAFPQRDLHIRSARGLAESGGPGSWAPGGAT